MKKVLYTATVLSHICQFHLPYLKAFQDNGYEVHVATRNNLNEKKGLTVKHVDKLYEVPFSRSPINLQNVSALKRLKEICSQENYDVVVCNTPVGGILTRIASKKLRENGGKVVYFTHGFHFFKGGPKINWLFYPIERYFCRHTDCLVVINETDYQLARKKFKVPKIIKLPGVGVDYSRFTNFNHSDFKQKLNLPADSKIIVSVGELNKNKNHQVILKALKYINNKNIHYLLVGNGPLDEKLKKFAQKLKIENNVHFLGYTRELAPIYNCSDVFVFPSKREGLGVACLEAMYCGLPVVTSNRHGINDYSQDGISGYKCSPNDYKGFAKAIEILVLDKKKCLEMGQNNKITANKYQLKNAIEVFFKILE